MQAPLTLPLPKVAPLVKSIVRLHNFYINKKELEISNVIDRSVYNIHCNVRYARHLGGKDSSMVDLDDKGRPVEALRHGYYFYDAPKHHEYPQ